MILVDSWRKVPFTLRNILEMLRQFADGTNNAARDGQSGPDTQEHRCQADPEHEISDTAKQLFHRSTKFNTVVAKGLVNLVDQSGELGTDLVQRVDHVLISLLDQCVNVLERARGGSGGRFTII